MNIHQWISFTTTALLSILCISQSSASTFSPGAKAAGMGSTGVAYSQDSLAGAYNPAGIVDVEDRIDFGFGWTRERGNIEIKPPIKNNTEDSGDSFESPVNFFNGEFGINKVFSTCFCNNYWDWAIGLVGYNQDYLKTSYKKPISFLGTTKAGLEYIHEIISPVISLRLNQCHAIGISLDVHFQRIRVNGLQELAKDNLSIFPQDVTNKGYCYSSDIGVSIGWKWEVMEALTVGATYHSKTSTRKFNKYKGLFAEEGQIHIPERYALGLAYQYLPNSTFTFDVEWIQWQEIKSLHNSIENLKKKQKFGSNEGPGFGFRNQIYFGLGLDYGINENWTIRMGYRQTNTFLKNTQTTLNILTCNTVESYLTLGATFTWRSNEFTAFFAHGFEHTVNGKKEIPEILDKDKNKVNLTESNNTLGISWGYLF